MEISQENVSVIVTLRYELLFCSNKNLVKGKVDSIKELLFSQPTADKRMVLINTDIFLTCEIVTKKTV